MNEINNSLKTSENGGVLNIKEKILEVKNLSKSFGANNAVCDISFDIKAGSFFAFLGQNGAGKSTTINMLIGLLQNDEGEICYAHNRAIGEFKNEIGVVFQNNILDDKLSVKENLQLYGTFYFPDKSAMKKRYNEIMSLFELREVEKKRFGKLSGGQKRKAEIARALFSSPKILFLDEPTTGLDPKTRKDVWGILHRVKRETGMTLFLTTHYMEETGEADRIVIIHKGIKVCEGSPFELKAKYSYDRFFIVPKNEVEFEEKLIGQNLQFKKTADNYIIRIDDTEQSIEILNALKKDIRFYEVKKGSMDDVFLTVVGESIREDIEK